MSMQTWDEHEPNQDAFLKAIDALDKTDAPGLQDEVRALNLIERRRNELGMAAATVTLIEKHQDSHPGYKEGALDSIVNSELRRLEKETGLSLDDLANDYPYFIGGAE